MVQNCIFVGRLLLVRDNDRRRSIRLVAGLRSQPIVIRQELIELSARWAELELQGSCPFSLTEEELKEHARDYEDFETIQKLKLWLRHSLHTNFDGWVPNHVWEAAKDAHRAAYDEWIRTAREPESRGESLTVAKADTLWPFDAR